MAPPDAKQISSQSGWSHLTKVWAHTVPQQIAISQKSREGLRRLIRTGR